MIHLELTADEARLLTEVLDADLADLSYEIANTDLLDYRNFLKDKRTAVARVLQGLGAGAV